MQRFIKVSNEQEFVFRVKRLLGLSDHSYLHGDNASCTILTESGQNETCRFFITYKSKPKLREKYSNLTASVGVNLTIPAPFVASMAVPYKYIYRFEYDGQMSNWQNYSVMYKPAEIRPLTRSSFINHELATSDQRIVLKSRQFILMDTPKASMSSQTASLWVELFHLALISFFYFVILAVYEFVQYFKNK